MTLLIIASLLHAEKELAFKSKQARSNLNEMLALRQISHFKVVGKGNRKYRFYSRRIGCRSDFNRQHTHCSALSTSCHMADGTACVLLASDKDIPVSGQTEGLWSPQLNNVPRIMRDKDEVLAKVSPNRILKYSKSTLRTLSVNRGCGDLSEESAITFKGINNNIFRTDLFLNASLHMNFAFYKILLCADMNRLKDLIKPVMPKTICYSPQLAINYDIGTFHSGTITINNTPSNRKTKVARVAVVTAKEQDKLQHSKQGKPGSMFANEYSPVDDVKADATNSSESDISSTFTPEGPRSFEQLLPATAPTTLPDIINLHACINN
ncbi:hypothetical protein EJB05_30886, partial [Eragrostis curvula]